MSDLESKQFHDAMTFVKTLDKESDRGVALTCAAYVDDRLKALLQNSFVDERKVIERLLDGLGPLATFSSKIDTVFLLGMMTEDDHRGIHLIRKIRNKFAHYHMPRNFNDPDLSAQCRELGKSLPLLPFKRASSSVRRLFINSSFAAIAGLNARILRARRTQMMKPSPPELKQLLFPWIENRLKAAYKNLPEDRKKRLLDPATATAEQELVVLETMKKTQAVLKDAIEQARREMTRRRPRPRKSGRPTTRLHATPNQKNSSARG